MTFDYHCYWAVCLEYRLVRLFAKRLVDELPNYYTTIALPVVEVFPIIDLDNLLLDHEPGNRLGLGYIEGYRWDEDLLYPIQESLPVLILIQLHREKN